MGVLGVVVVGVGEVYVGVRVWMGSDGVEGVGLWLKFFIS